MQNQTPSAPHLEESCLASEQVYSGGLLQVFRDQVRLPDGGESVREHIRHPGAAMIVPRLASGEFVLVRQFRYPLQRVFLEFPAGKLDAGEAPLSCAMRELAEETGYSASLWNHLGEMHPVIGYADEVIHIYLAQGLQAGEAQPDQGEFVELLTMTLDELLAAVSDGRITDGKTIAGVFHAWRIFGARDGQ